MARPVATGEDEALTKEELGRLYQWLDQLPFSRPKRNVTRDFSDGLMVAELVKNYFSRLVDLHNYSPANSFIQKTYNWNTLNQKVFKKLHFTLRKDEIERICNCVPGAVEIVLRKIRQHMVQYQAELAQGLHQDGGSPGSPEQSQQPHPQLQQQQQQSQQPQQQQQPQEQQQQSYQQQYQQQQPQQQQQQQQQQSPLQPPQRVAKSATGSRPKLGVPPAHAKQLAPLAAPPMPAPAPSAAPEPAAGSQLAASDLATLLMNGQKDQLIEGLKQTVDMLQQKIAKMEQLLFVKDSKIQHLTAQLNAVSGPRATG